MILLIHTADIENIFLGLIDNGRFLARKKFTARYRQSEKLLIAIEKIMLANGLGVKDIEGIAVVTGPGPFSALRIGIATANALSRALKVKIIGIRADKFSSLEELPAVAQKGLLHQKKGAIIEPFYGREPNITLNNK